MLLSPEAYRAPGMRHTHIAQQLLTLLCWQHDLTADFLSAIIWQAVTSILQVLETAIAISGMYYFMPKLPHVFDNLLQVTVTCMVRGLVQLRCVLHARRKYCSALMPAC